MDSEEKLWAICANSRLIKSRVFCLSVHWKTKKFLQGSSFWCLNRHENRSRIVGVTVDIHSLWRPAEFDRGKTKDRDYSEGRQVVRTAACQEVEFSIMSCLCILNTNLVQNGVQAHYPYTLSQVPSFDASLCYRGNFGKQLISTCR